MVILWGHQSAAGVHCHGISHCEFEVLAGAVEESREDDRWHALGQGEVNACGAGCEHDVRCQETLAVTVHRYRPPLGDAPDAMFADSVQLGGDLDDTLGRLQGDAGIRPWILVRADDRPGGCGSVHNEVVRRLGTSVRPAATEPDGSGTEAPVMRSTTAGCPDDVAVHSAHAYLAQPPTYVVMTCIDDIGEDAMLLSPVGALRTLGGEDVGHLRRPAFRFSRPTAGKPWLSPPRPAVSMDGGRLRMRCGTDAVPVDADAAEACRHMHDTIADHTRGVELHRGDILVVNNRLAAHGWDAPRPMSRHLLTTCVWDQADYTATP